MLIVGTDQAVVETHLAAGRLGCPPCGGVLGPWGHARRRVLRRRTGEELVRPRRTRCRSCRSTHVIAGRREAELAGLRIAYAALSGLDGAGPDDKEERG